MKAQKITEITPMQIMAINAEGWYIRQVISVKETMTSNDPPFSSYKIYLVLLEKEIDG